MATKTRVRSGSSGGALPWRTVDLTLQVTRSAWLSTTRPDGRPHVAPVWGLWLEEVFYFSSDRASRKARNLEANPALVVHLESGDDVVILEGVAERVADMTALTAFADAYNAKYGFRPDPANPDYAVFRLRPRVAHAWTEQDFPLTATRWRFP